MADPRYIDGEELEGKTVAKVVETNDKVLMRFTDGSFTSLVRNPGYYGDPGDVAFEEPTDRGDLLAIGLMTTAEYEALEQRDRERRAEAERVARQRRYEELKREFDKPHEEHT